MKYKYKIIPERNLVQETWEGQLSKQDLIAAFSQLSADPEWKKHMNVIADFRSAQIDLSTQDMQDYVHWVRQNDTPKFLAIIVGRTVDFGMSRMFQILSETNFYEDSKIFYDLNQAEKWIESKYDYKS